MDYKMPKHHNNLMKTVEGTGWVLCDALNTIVKKNITPSESNNSGDSLLANNINEMFQIVAECEEEEIIDHLADKIVEYAGNDIDSFVNYIGQNMGDNPLYKKVYELSQNKFKKME